MSRRLGNQIRLGQPHSAALAAAAAATNTPAAVTPRLIPSPLPQSQPRPHKHKQFPYGGYQPPNSPSLYRNRGRGERAFTTTPRWLVSGAGAGGGDSILDTSASHLTETEQMVRDGVLAVCARFPSAWWRERDELGADPAEFHAALAAGGWLGVALPEGLASGSGLGIAEATAMMQAIAESGAGMAGAQAVHANVYATQPLARFGTAEQRASVLPRVVSGQWRVCFGVTEPDAGLDTLRLKTVARKENGDGNEYYRVTGQKIWITCAQVARKMMLLARTTPLEHVRKPSEGLSLFCVDLDRDAPGLAMRRIKKMGVRAVDANEVFFDDYRIPADTLVGPEGQGFRVVLHGMNAERCLLAGEALGLGYAALGRAAQYARERVVFGRPIGQNQGVAHPLADAWMQLEAAKLATYHAARLYDQSQKQSQSQSQQETTSTSNASVTAVGVAANTAKYLAAEAAFRACERAVLAHGGMGYAVEYDVERWLRECLVPRIAPVSREMIMNYVAEKVLRLPRSY
ncbi:hypothetical protein SLS62_006726 [Diatrype stigma]|uniref:Acyl-CoA dehydrogenase n=1 Tax=Diatrype stigma TaxID=117547 RepID=A0AAN9UMS2_9PEZI